MSTKELESALREQAQELDRIASDPLETATVLEAIGDDLLVATGRGRSAIKAAAQKVKPGQSILIHRESGQFIRSNPFPAEGFIATVTDIIEPFAVIEIDGRTRVLPTVPDLKAGDRVVLDEFAAFILRVLPKTVSGYAVPETDVSWDDIGGNAEAKAAMIEAIEHPHKYRKLYEHYGARGARGIMLYGPPGCGKTMLGKAAATSIGSSDGFIYCKGPEVLDPYVGVAEATVRSLFSRARDFQADHGKRAVVFIDEAESLLGSRAARNAHMEKTIVPTFLAEMDGVEDSGAVVILATNRNMALDPAVVRDGRVDRRIEVGRPSADDAKQIVFSHLRKTPTTAPPEALAERVVDLAWSESFSHNGATYPLQAFASGSLFAGIVDKAKARAMRRDIADNTVSGVGPEDMDSGLALAISEMGSTSLEALM